MQQVITMARTPDSSTERTGFGPHARSAADQRARHAAYEHEVHDREVHDPDAHDDDPGDRARERTAAPEGPGSRELLTAHELIRRALS